MWSDHMWWSEGGLCYTNTALRYAMHGKWNVLIAGGVFQQTGGATLLLPLHSNIFLHLLLNINGNFGWCSRSCHYSCFREALVKLDIHSKYFCLHSARLFFFILSAETFMSVSWFVRSSCQRNGCSLLWISRRDVVARNDNHHIVPAFLLFPASPSL